MAGAQKKVKLVKGESYQAFGKKFEKGKPVEVDAKEFKYLSGLPVFEEAKEADDSSADNTDDKANAK